MLRWYEVGVDIYILFRLGFYEASIWRLVVIGRRGRCIVESLVDADDVVDKRNRKGLDRKSDLHMRSLRHCLCSAQGGRL